jgi:hypothetical protein
MQMQAGEYLQPKVQNIIIYNPQISIKPSYLILENNSEIETFYIWLTQIE